MIRKLNFDKIEKILVISLSNIGDVILTTPVISLLRQRFPQSYLAVMVGPKAESLFQNSSTIDKLLIFDKKEPLGKKVKLLWDLWKNRFDLVIDLRNTAIPFFIWPRYRTSFFVKQSSKLMRQRHLDQIEFLMPVHDFVNRFDFFSPLERQTVDRKLGQCGVYLDQPMTVILAPGAGSELKRWTVSGFSELANHFLKQNAFVILVGDEREDKIGNELERNMIKPVANLIGKLTLRELAALIDGASLVVANDSAVMHMSHELNRPTVAIFGPTNEKKYGRGGFIYKTVRLHLDCAPCEKAQCALERRKCLDDLSSAEVIQACDELLAHASN